MSIRYHPYDQIEPVLDGSSPAQTGGGTYIDLPFLSLARNGYEWFSLMSYDSQRYDSSRTKIVKKDHIPDQGIVKDFHIRNRLEFKGKHTTPHDIVLCKEELELHRRGINATVTA